MLIQERYASAIRSANLRSDERTTYSDTDVLGAMGLASRDDYLPIALQRLLLGDNHASEEIVSLLTGMILGKAKALRVDVTAMDCRRIGEACLAWFRNSACPCCGGHGYLLIEGTKTLGDRPCETCKGTGKRPFEEEFHRSQRELAAWVLAEMERDLARAGGLAMAKIAPKLEL